MHQPNTLLATYSTGQVVSSMLYYHGGVMQPRLPHRADIADLEMSGSLFP